MLFADHIALITETREKLQDKFEVWKRSVVIKIVLVKKRIPVVWGNGLTENN